MKVGVDDFLAGGRTLTDLNALPRQAFAPAGSLGTDWPTIAPEAFYGVAGGIVKTLDPYTEADPVAVLLHVLVAVGNLIGDGPHALVSHDPHPCRLFAGFVGASGKGRKGTEWSGPRHLLRQIDEPWFENCVKTGLSSGEGLIYHVRDPVEKEDDEGERQLIDPGVSDKRLLIIEPELAVVFKRMGGEGNSLSGVIRQAWDGGTLSTLTKNSALKATRPHISIIGHITVEELRRELTEIARANGFANRFLWLLVRRSKLLPEGEPTPEHLLEPLLLELRDVVTFARVPHRLTRDVDATAMWAAVYGPLSEGETDGLLSAVTSRAEAQVLRLSVIYATLDRSPFVRPNHLEAALAVWRYAETSAGLIFGDRIGDPVADKILDGLRVKGPLGRTPISALFKRNLSADRIEMALKALAARGLIRPHVEKTAGRDAEVWELASPTPEGT